MPQVLFDIIISNPPYQEETARREVGRSADRSIYPMFLSSMMRFSTYVLMIHPLRSFVVNTRTDTSTVKQLVDNPYFKVVSYYEDNTVVFPHVDVKGGIIISSFHPDNTIQHKDFKELLPEHLENIKNKVVKYSYPSIMQRIELASRNKLTADVVGKYSLPGNKLNTNIIDRAPKLFSPDYDVNIVGRYKGKRCHTAIHSENIFIHDTWKNFYKVVIPASHGGKKRGSLGITEILPPGDITTATFLSFGGCTSYEEAKNVNSYIHSKLARALLSIKKITQHGNKATWEYVPDIQCYNNNSVIDWSGNIDNQLYALFQLSAEEIEWLEENINV